MNPTRDILADVEAARVIVGQWRVDKADRACRRVANFRRLRFTRLLFAGINRLPVKCKEGTAKFFMISREQERKVFALAGYDINNRRQAYASQKSAARTTKGDHR